MLGNSARGLSAYHKRLLYRTCVVPIATYGYKLWSFEGSKNKWALESLRKMQRKAAIWITGAFRTVPSGGVEIIAGLLPIHLQLKRLTKNSTIRMLTLTHTHPLRALLGGVHRGGAQESPHSVDNTKTQIEKGVLKSSIIDIVNELDAISERLNPHDEEARPGNRVVDIYGSRTTFTGITVPETNWPLHLRATDPITAQALADLLRGQTRLEPGRTSSLLVQ